MKKTKLKKLTNILLDAIWWISVLSIFAGIFINGWVFLGGFVIFMTMMSVAFLKATPETQDDVLEFMRDNF